MGIRSREHGHDRADGDQPGRHRGRETQQNADAECREQREAELRHDEESGTADARAEARQPVEQQLVRRPPLRAEERNPRPGHARTSP